MSETTTISRASAVSGVAAALISRAFYGLMVEGPALDNGAWLSILVGLALALPTLWLFRRGVGRSARLLLAAALFVDAMKALEGAAFSESCIAFNHIPSAVLALPLLAAAARCLVLGGDAVGASARIWMRLFIPALGLIVALQWSYYRPLWLTPVLGHGPGRILRGGVRCWLWMVMLGGAGMALCREQVRFERVVRTLAVAALVTAMLILLRLMMAPACLSGDMGRALRLDALLTNGRAPLLLQLPMIVIWFVGLTHLLCFETWCAVALVRKRS